MQRSITFPISSYLSYKNNAICTNCFVPIHNAHVDCRIRIAIVFIEILRSWFRFLSPECTSNWKLRSVISLDLLSYCLNTPLESNPSSNLSRSSSSGSELFDEMTSGSAAAIAAQMATISMTSNKFRVATETWYSSGCRLYGSTVPLCIVFAYCVNA